MAGVRGGAALPDGLSRPLRRLPATEVAVSKTCLVRFDNNHYSVAARAVGRPVDVRAYADRIVIRQDGETVAEHPRSFGRGEIAYDPWHYVPILTRKPGVLRNGAPFKGWQLPGALGRIRARLTGCDDGDRQFVRILAGRFRRTGWRRSRRPVPRRSTAAPAAPTSCSTSSPGSASRHRRRPSRRPRACSFATGRWPTVSATTA